MKIFNQYKTHELKEDEVDLSKGRLENDRIVTQHHNAVEKKVIKPAQQIAEEYRLQGKAVNLRDDGNLYVTVKAYENGGTDEELIDDIVQEAKEDWDEYEDILVYVPYTAAEIAQFEIDELKAQLAATDYQAIKYAEGELTEEEYAPTKAQRREWRARINELEAYVQ